MKKDLRELKALNKKYKISIKIDKNMPDYSNDPVVLAKNEKARKLIAEFGLPEDFKRKPKAKSLKRKKKTS
jgi:hypothetical protein